MKTNQIYSGGDFLIADMPPRHVFTPEDFSKTHKMIYNATADFVRKQVLPNREQIETKDEAISRKLLAQTGDLGLNGTDIPEAYGGEEMDKVSTCLVTEAMGAAGSFSITHSIHTGIGMLPIAYFGSPEQKQRYLPLLCSGEWIGAYCLTEPGAGSDALNSQTTAVLSEDGRHYIINGEKIFITNGSWADCYAVYAKIDGEDFTGFIVEKDFEGFQRGVEEKKMGLTGSSTCTIIFKNCKVPVENMLYEKGKGHKIAFNILNMGRYKIGANTMGGSKAAIAQAAAHAATRVQFGRPIGSFGMVKNKLADMVIRTYMTESMVYRLAAMIDARSRVRKESGDADPYETVKDIEEYAAECSIIKVYGSECLDFCVDEWMQILGGAGYTAEYPAEQAYRDSRINRIVEGTNEINRLLIPQTFLKRAMKGRFNLEKAFKGLEQDSRSGSILDDSVLAAAQHRVRASKKVLILAFGATAQEMGPSLTQDQGVLEILANMMMEIFAMDSGLVRALKVLETKGAQKADIQIAAVNAYTVETFHKIEFWAKQVICTACRADALEKYVAEIETLADCPTESVIPFKQTIAERVIKLKKYIY